MSQNIVFSKCMKYLIKLEDFSDGRAAFVECPAEMSLEDLSIKIKVEMCLPYTDHCIHAFQMHGKVYVPDVAAVRELWRIDDLATGIEYIQGVRNYPREQDILSSAGYKLNQIYTIIGSAVTYIQSSCHKIRCTLVERIGD